MIWQKIKKWLKREPDLSGKSLDEIDEEAILSSLSSDDDFISLLKQYARKDKENYFVARDERARLLIRGQYLRTLSLLKKIGKLKTLKVATKEEIKSPMIGRYGV